MALAVAALATALSCRRLAEAAEAYVATASPYGREVQCLQKNKEKMGEKTRG